VSPAVIMRIWEDQEYRLFLSHKSDVSKEANKLKTKLKVYGVSAFVAHTNIRPTLAWQSEIESALYSMDALAALMTKRISRQRMDRSRSWLCAWTNPAMKAVRPSVSQVGKI
jgi:hypothetical protein